MSSLYNRRIINKKRAIGHLYPLWVFEPTKLTKTPSNEGEILSGRSDSNRRMLAWKANALPLGDARVAFILADSLWLSNYSHNNPPPLIPPPRRGLCMVVSPTVEGASRSEEVGLHQSPPGFTVPL